jgi:hypothetical protein
MGGICLVLASSTSSFFTQILSSLHTIPFVGDPESKYARQRFVNRAYAVYRVIKLLMASHDDSGSIRFTSNTHTNHICSHQRAARILS